MTHCPQSSAGQGSGPASLPGTWSRSRAVAAALHAFTTRISALFVQTETCCTRNTRHNLPQSHGKSAWFVREPPAPEPLPEGFRRAGQRARVASRYLVAFACCGCSSASTQHTQVGPLLPRVEHVLCVTHETLCPYRYRQIRVRYLSLSVPEPLPNGLGRSRQRAHDALRYFVELWCRGLFPNKIGGMEASRYLAALWCRGFRSEPN